MKRSHTTLPALLLALIFLIAGILATLANASSVPAENYAVKLEAAQRMQACMDAIKAYREEAGIAITEEDWFETGLLGERFTGITTTLGSVEAKRTTCNSDMAALAVELLTEAGMQEGDTIGIGMSGSFPALDIAVLCAADAMGLNVVYIASIGTSTYGATAPELPLPAMLCRLEEDGLISTLPVAWSIGGDYDTGANMEEEALETAIASFASYDLPQLYEEDFLTNLELRMSLYETYGPISCFVGIGGNVTTSGPETIQTEQGVLWPDDTLSITDTTGLVDRYRAQGIPSIVLLNIEDLVTDYGLPFDPTELPEIGTSAIYYTTAYPRVWAVLGLGGAALSIASIPLTRRRRRQDQVPPASDNLV